MPFRFAENDRTTFASIATELPYSSDKKTQLNKRIEKYNTSNRGNGLLTSSRGKAEKKIDDEKQEVHAYGPHQKA